jgi:hypothetical protein
MTTATLPRPQARPAKAKPRDVCSWLVRPTPLNADARDWTGVLAINGEPYLLTATNCTDPDSGRWWLVVDLRHDRRGGRHHRCTLSDGESVCDCEFSTYRPDEKPCRHRRALAAALNHLGEAVP